MFLPEFSIEGSTAVITGAGRGIGRGIALAMAEAGADLCLAARTVAELDQTAKLVRGTGRKCVTVRTDVRKPKDVDCLAETAVRELGHVDVLVCNAGLSLGKPIVPLPDYAPRTGGADPNYFHPLSDDEWLLVVDTNLNGPFYCLRAFGPHMLERRKGKVIMVTSVSAERSSPKRASYDASKAGLAHLVRSVAREWAEYGVTVNAIGPGYIDDAGGTGGASAAIKAGIASRLPLKRLGTPREIGLAAVYLASPATDYMTGQTIYLDGGYLT